MRGSADAVIFDVYGTLIECVPNDDPSSRLLEIWEGFFGKNPAPTWREFAGAVEYGIERRHATARGEGVRFPEVDWRSVIMEVLRDRGIAPRPPEVSEFATQVISCWRSVRMVPGADLVLAAVFERADCWGLASNAQFYTKSEMQLCLGENLVRRLFIFPELVQLSFELGFSKPAAEFFHRIANSLELRGIPRDRVVMVGDRADNDTIPAKKAGFLAWQAGETADGPLPDFARQFGFLEGVQ